MYRISQSSQITPMIYEELLPEDLLPYVSDCWIIDRAVQWASNGVTRKPSGFHLLYRRFVVIYSFPVFPFMEILKELMVSFDSFVPFDVFDVSLVTLSTGWQSSYLNLHTSLAAMMELNLYRGTNLLHFLYSRPSPSSLLSFLTLCWHSTIWRYVDSNREIAWKFAIIV